MIGFFFIIDATLLDRYYVSAMLCVREYYLVAIIQAVMVLQAVIQQWNVDEAKIPDIHSLTPDLQKVWDDVKALKWDTYANVVVGNGEILSGLLYEKGVSHTIEVIIETYLRKCGR